MNGEKRYLQDEINRMELLLEGCLDEDEREKLLGSIKKNRKELERVIDQEAEV